MASLSIGLVGLVGLAPSASAQVSPVIPRSAQVVTADSLPTVQIDGQSIVWAQVTSGNTVYAGGQFSNVRPAGAASGTNLTPRGNLLAYDITTGNLITSFAPNLNATVKALALSPDGKRLYVGGAFVSANGVDRYRLAAYDTATGALVSSFAPSLNATVTAITATNSTVYVGGYFGVANGSNRTRLAAFRASDGALTTWAPTADYDVTSMVLSPDKAKVVVGGAFQNVNGAPVQGITALDPATGSTIPWPVNQVIHNGNAQAGTFSLSTDSDTIYGTSYNYGTGNFEGQFAMNQDGTIKWLADCHGDTYAAFSPDNGIVYGSGHAHYCSNIGGFPDTNPRDHHFLMAFTKDATGTVQPNGQGGSGYGDFSGQPSPSIVNFYPSFTVANVSGASQAVWSLTGNKQYLAAGGEFPTVNGKVQQGLTRFALSSIAPNKMGPVDLGGVTNPSVTPIGGYGARVAWKLNWDPDDTTLTYKIVRADKAATPLYTTSLASTFWQRPTSAFVDKTAQAGQTYRYRVVVTDPSGNGTQSDYVSVTMPTTSLSSYGKAVLDDGANNFWRLGDSDQPTLTDLAGGNAMSKASGVTSAASGAIIGDSDTSATYDGSAGVTGASTAVTAPDTFSVEAWIKTTTTSGGKILGFGNSSTGTSSSYDRHVYMDNSGRLTFGVYPGSVQTVTTGDTYNDGSWHHVVAEMSTAGMALWVDGIQQGVNTTTTTGQPYSGYWRAGGDNLNAWPNRGSSDYFAGQIDDFAVYPTALTVTQIRDHYTKSGRTVDLPSQPTDTYGQTVYADNPTLFWRLDDSTGPTVKDASQSRQPGVSSGGVSLRSPSTVTPAGTAFAFNGADGTVGSRNQFSNPTVYSEEVWFNTVSGQGGKLIGFGNAQGGRSSHYDRHVYMEDSGQLTFGTYTGQLNTITSPSAYNDGSWHHMVATQGADGMKLYVDGVLTGSNPQTGAEGYDGYWRVGGDSDWGGSSAFLAGSVDEAAVYPVALTAAQVRAHYVASPAARNSVPVASFAADSCTDGACTFDASASADADGSIASYAWSFGDRTSASGAKPQHTYTAPGSYDVTLTVTDDRGATSSVTQTLVIALNRAPVASFTSSCTERACAFDGSASTDPDGSVASYAWDFGDGSSSTQVTPAHPYAQDGTYTVTLTVTDNQGKTAQLTKQVVAKLNQKPVAVVASTCSALACNFDGTGSTDADGSIATYAWDFGDQSTATGSAVPHTYGAAGTYSVTLTVTDDKGATGTATKTVTVAKANVKPTASFTSSCGTLVCSFDASASSDSDGTVKAYAWDFGDNTTPGSGKTTSHSYVSGGSYVVKLTVTDDQGATDVLSRTLTVNGPVVAASDQFGRTATKWGSADTGGAWTQSSASPFSTNGSSGSVKLASAGSSASASLDSVSAADSTITVDVSTDKAATGNGTYANLVTRKTGTSFYTMKVRFMADGTLHLAAARTLNGSETTFKEVAVSGLSYTPGTVLRAKFVVTGSSTATLTGKVWQASGTEPTAVQLTSTDTAALQSSGGVGLSTGLSGTSTAVPVTVTFDNFVAIKQ